MFTVHPTADAVADAAADLVATALETSPSLTIGLAGGSTPAATYRRLASSPLDWGSATLWLGDERWVPADHPDANAHMVRSTLGAAAARLVAPDYGLGDPHRAAEAYAKRLGKVFATPGSSGRPDLVLLGTGADGHTASLFPGTAALETTDVHYVANWVENMSTWRLTATLPLLQSAKQTVFLVTGEAKAEMVSRILDDHEPYPAQLVTAGSPNVGWLLDEAAASRLRSA